MPKSKRSTVGMQLDSLSFIWIRNRNLFYILVSLTQTEKKGREGKEKLIEEVLVYALGEQKGLEIANKGELGIE